MGILTRLLEGEQIRFTETDADTWSLSEDQTVLHQWIDTVMTDVQLPIVSISEDQITLDWGGTHATATMQDLIFVTVD